MVKTYTTVQGDMWDSVAHAQLGSTAHTGALMRRNQQYLGLYSFPAGIVLTLPEVTEAVSLDERLPPWKRGKRQ